MCRVVTQRSHKHADGRVPLAPPHAKQPETPSSTMSISHSPYLILLSSQGHVDLDTVAVWWSGAYGVHIKNPTPTNTSPGPCTLTPHSFVRNRKGDVMTGNLVVNFPVPGPGLPEASGAAARGARGDEAVEWASQQELLGHLLQVTSEWDGMRCYVAWSLGASHESVGWAVLLLGPWTITIPTNNTP